MNNLKELIERYKMVYTDSNKQLEETFKIINADLPPRYYMNKGVLEFISVLEKEIDIYENKS